MNPIKVFWLEPTTKRRHQLRRYAHSDEKCSAKPHGMSCHDARIELGVVDDPQNELIGYHAEVCDADSWKSGEITREDSRWPTHCACGYAFTAEDVWQVNYDHLYEARGGAHDGSLFDLRDAPAGAMWDASWFRSYGHGEAWTGPDGISLVVKLPNGSDWCVDSECSNCTRPQSIPVDGEPGVRRFARTHYCWVRRGDPRTGDTHVDKGAPGESCAAGAGSILAGDFHGFLHNGYLVSC